MGTERGNWGEAKKVKKELKKTEVSMLPLGGLILYVVEILSRK